MSVKNTVIQNKTSIFKLRKKVRNIKKFLENCNKLFQAGSISSKADEWRQIISDKWVLQTAEGAKIEIDVSALAFNSKNKYETVWSKIRKINFRKKINRLMSRGVIKPILNSENGFASSIFLREKKGNKHRLILNLKRVQQKCHLRTFQNGKFKNCS